MKRGVIWQALPLTLLILGPALINGYPLVYSDSGTYLRSGFEMSVPADRPIGYGLFLRAFSLDGISAWLPMIIQALISAPILMRIQRILAPRLPFAFLLSITLLLSLGTALGWYGGRIMPDMFTAPAILVVLARAMGGRGNGWLAFDIAVVLLACITHLSNIPVLLALLAIVSLFLLSHKLRQMLSLKRMVPLFLAVGLSIPLIQAVNRGVGGDPELSTGGHVFILGRLLDTGQLEPFLEEDCRDHHHFRCGRDKLPINSQKFLWDPDSPVNTQGGWAATRGEGNALLGRFFRDPARMSAFIFAGIRDTGTQLRLWGLENEMISTWYRAEDSAPSIAIQAYLPHEMPMYRAALQNGGRGELRMVEVNLLHHLLMILGLMGAIGCLVPALSRGITRQQKLFLLLVLIGILLAAGSGAALSVPHQRFLAKVSWMLPFVVMLIYAERYAGRATARVQEVMHAAPPFPPVPSAHAPSAENAASDAQGGSGTHRRS
jgi:hypothetical protein